MLRLKTLVLDELTSDPSSPVDGEMWYNTTEDRVKIRRNGATEVVFDKDEFDAHTGDTSNPHTVTLEQARAGGNQLSGDIDANGNKFTGLGNGTAGSQDACTVSQMEDEVASAVQGLDWQESVLDKDLATPPGSPSTGDRYIVADSATDDWATHEDDIAEWDGSAWDFTTPTEGACCRAEDENKVYQFDGSSWGLWDALVDHGSMVGLGDDDHTQYHNDSRWDTRLGTKTTTDLAEGDNKYATAARILRHKAGRVLAATFDGTPQKATVTFSTAFADASYAVVLTPVTTDDTGFAPFVESQAAGSFVINLGSDSKTGLTQVNWMAMVDGEATAL